MRAIKFRGKCCHSDAWVFGDLEVNRLDERTLIHTYYDDKRYHCQCDVRADTVGQFTSLYDKNGEEIYEGDILALQETDNKVTHCPVSMNCKGYWSIDFGINYGVCLGLVDKKRVEVIGNIHDNPELLKGYDNKMV